MLISELFYTISRKISVEGCTSNIELIDDVTDKRVVFDVLEHGLSVLDSLLVHSFWPTPSASAFVGGFKTGAGIFYDQFSLEFIEGSSHVEE